MGSHPSSQLLTVGNEHFLIDCGEGTQYRLLEAHVRLGRLSSIFITHLHGDHYFGLFGLLNTLSLGGRTKDLYLFGPRGLGEILPEVFRQSGTQLTYPLHFQETDPDRPGPLWSTANVTVETLPLRHRVPCTGFLFRERKRLRSIQKDKLPDTIHYEHIRLLKEGQDVLDERGTLLYKNEDYTLPPPRPRAYAYCSDTLYWPELVPYIRGVDALYHEATFLTDLSELAEKTFHSTAWQAATIARDAGVGQLLIGHLSSRYPDPQPSLAEAQAIFPNTVMAVEGQVFDIANLPHTLVSDNK
ncbi:ribonuclease Z [Rhabdobacter roseus]|uniref:Ribonuclease Z n=2 Tax=Rhabdobacter roseus TaxID=1655419 RepID=A0A840TSX1_9BACT|nr:ribonuclease Z [Rhabdobacter roseus]